MNTLLTLVEASCSSRMHDRKLSCRTLKPSRQGAMEGVHKRLSARSGELGSTAAPGRLYAFANGRFREIGRPLEPSPSQLAVCWHRGGSYMTGMLDR
jgi:hypothetical protein